MRAKERTLLLLLALVAALSVGLLLLTRANVRAEQAASAAEEGTIPLSSFAVDDLTRIVYTYDGETLTLDYADGVWTLAEDPEYHISQSLCDTMAAALCALNAKRSLEAGTGEDYGTGTPLVTVTVTAAGETNTFYFGDTNGVTGDIYLQKEGDETIYTASSSKVACFEYRKAELFEPFDPAGLTRSALQEIEYEVADGDGSYSVRLVARSEPVTADDAAESASEAAESAADGEESTEYETVWRLADELSADLDSDALETLLSAFGSSVTGQITEPEALEDYGLDAPLVRVQATTEAGTTELAYAIGADGYYLQVAGDTSVYTVDGSTVEAFCQTAEQLKAGAE